jgi:hypothetical protein
MCGIVGVLSMGTVKDNLKAEIMQCLFTEILHATEERGKDATGVSTLFSDGMSYIQKGPVTATEFIGSMGDDETSYNKFMSSCTEYAEEKNTAIRLFMGHCRKSSVGGAFDNVNNHPVKVNEIVGVHNGTLDNHNKIFANLGCKRDGIVDTEAIMRLLDYYTGYCTEPFTIEGLEETARRLEGAYSVIAYNANNPFQLSMMRKERPFEIALLKNLKIMLIASDRLFFSRAIFHYNKLAYLFNKLYEPIKSTEVEVFTLPLDNVGIVHLNKEVKEDTVIKDLITIKDVFKATKIWKSPIKTTYNKTVYNQHNSKKNEDPKIASQEKPAATGNIIDNSSAFKGKIFCKKLNTYVAEQELAEAEKEPAKVINIPDGKVMNLSSHINVVSAEVKSLPVKSLPEPVKIVMNEVETVNDSLAEAMKASTEHINFRTRFSTGKEVAEALDIKSVDSLDELPAHALVNRAKEVIYKDAFVDGALWFKKHMLGKETSTQADSTKSVRIAKHVVEIFGNVIEQLADKDVEKMASKIHSEIKKKNISELSLDNIRQVFSKGDTMSNKALIALKDLV